MFTKPLAGAANTAFVSFRAVSPRRPLLGFLKRGQTVADTPPPVDDAEELTIADEANWLDLDREEQIAFDEKLSKFLDLDVDNKEREWLLPNG